MIGLISSSIYPSRTINQRPDPVISHTEASARRRAKAVTKLTFNGAKFELGNAIRHFYKGDGVRTNGTFNGGHTQSKYASNIRVSGGLTRRSIPHPSRYGQGITHMDYQPRKQAGSRGDGNKPLGGRFGKPQEKTVIDPAIRSHEQLMRDTREALRNGMMGPEFIPNATYNKFPGYTQNGIKMRFYISGHGNGSYTVRSFYYEL